MLSDEDAAFGIDNCNLRINSFYKAPVGQENWAVKHIKPRPASLVAEPHHSVIEVEKRAPVLRRLPLMRPKVKAVPSRFASNVIRNHYRTQDVLEESS